MKVEGQIGAARSNAIPASTGRLPARAKLPFLEAGQRVAGVQGRDNFAQPYEVVVPAADREFKAGISML
jgi:hypothetical protein